MDDIGVFSPEQARALWQDYQTRKQLTPQVSQNYPVRRIIDEPSPHRVFVKNTSSETCPAYGCLQITGVTVAGGITVVTIDKPSTTSSEYLFNSQFEILAGEYGWAYRFGVVIAIGDPPSEVNVVYDPIVDSWEIAEGGSLFVVFGEHNVTTRGLIGKFAGGAVNVKHGIVTSNLGCGYYTIEKAIWSGDREEAGSGLGSGSGIDDCNPCFDVTGEGTADCAITLTVPPLQVTGIGEYVMAYDSASTIIPLIVGTSVKMINMGDTNSATGSGSGSGDDATPVWQILRGMMNHIVKYEEEWDCCDGPYENGVETLISRTPNILIGITCNAIPCGECHA